MVFSEAEVQQHEREYEWYVKYQCADDVLNMELDCVGNNLYLVKCMRL